MLHEYMARLYLPEPLPEAPKARRVAAQRA
jgi:hypothetical protein